MRCNAAWVRTRRRHSQRAPASRDSGNGCCGTSRSRPSAGPARHTGGSGGAASAAAEPGLQTGPTPMDPVVTIIITPRDRYSGLDECVEAVYRHTPQPFRLWIMDLDYPASVIAPVRERLRGRPEVRFFDIGLRTPMDALREVQPLVHTPAVVLLDNDSRVTEGWLAPLLGALGDGHAVVSPLILEREGVDRGAPLRNHLYTGELRVVDVGDTSYIFERKHFRRAEIADIPQRRSETGTFELHCVLFDGDVFRRIELPSMVIREHLDISLQVAAMGRTMVVEPRSVIHFDNLGTRMALSDMRFFRSEEHTSELQ